MTHISFGFTNSEFSTILAELNLAPAALNFHRPANFHRPNFRDFFLLSTREFVVRIKSRK